MAVAIGGSVPPFFDGIFDGAVTPGETVGDPVVPGGSVEGAGVKPGVTVGAAVVPGGKDAGCVVTPGVIVGDPVVPGGSVEGAGFVFGVITGAIDIGDVDAGTADVAGGAAGVDVPDIGPDGAAGADVNLPIGTETGVGAMGDDDILDGPLEGTVGGHTIFPLPFFDLSFIPFPFPFPLPLGDGDGMKVVVGTTVRSDEPFPFPFPLLFEAVDGIGDMEGTKETIDDDPFPIIPFLDNLSLK